MKQDVEVIIRFNYTNQSSNPVDNEPSLKRVRRDLYDMLLDQTLHYEERRTNSLQDYVEQMSDEQLDEVVFDTDYAEFLEWASKSEFMDEARVKNDEQLAHEDKVFGKKYLKGTNIEWPESLDDVAQQLINRRHEDTSIRNPPPHSHEYHRFPGTKKSDYSVSYEVSDKSINKKEDFNKRVQEARESFQRWSDDNIETVKEEESSLVDSSPYRHIMPIPSDETQLEFDFKTE